MKILVVCQHFYPEQFRINDICFELAKRGNEVTVLTGLPNYPKGKVLKDYKWLKNRKQIINNVKVIRSFLIGRGKSAIMMGINYLCFAIMASIKAIFIKKDFDIVYVYQISPITMAIPAIIVKKMIKKPLIIHCLDQWPISITIGGIKKTAKVYKFFYRLSKWVYNQADLITISSKSFKKYFIEELKIKDKGLIYWPSYAETSYNNIKYKEDDNFDLVFAGNIGPAQSVETIIEAANILRNDKHIKFHIVGDGLNKDNCEKLAKKYSLENIIFYGFHPVEKMPDFYKIADAFLITMADNEIVNNTLPAKIQSYMSAGRPIIGAINGEVKDVVNEAKCGVCCRSLDYKSLANLILSVYQDKNKLNQWGKNGKEYYQRNFTKNKSLNDLEKIMSNITKDTKNTIRDFK